MAIARPPKVTGSGVASQAIARPGKLLSGWPNVLAFLSLTSWPDGSQRKTGEITLGTENGLWKARIKDPEGIRVAFYAADTVDDLLSQLDERLESDRLEWRLDGYELAKSKKKP